MNFECRIGSKVHKSITFSCRAVGVFAYIAPGTPRAVARVVPPVLIHPPGYYFGVSMWSPGWPWSLLGEMRR